MNKRPTIYAWIAILFLVAAAVYAADEIVSRTINYQNSTLTFDANTTIKDADGNWTINWSQFQFLSTNTGGGGGITNSGGSKISQGTAAPEGSVTGNKNDMYHQISGGVLQRTYIKTTDGGNTGWF